MSGRISCIDASQDRLTISDAVILESDTKSFKIASLVPVMLAPGILNEGSLSSNSCLGQTITVRGVFSRPTDQCFSFQGKPSSYLASRGVYFQLSRAYPDRHSQLALQSHSNFSDWSGFCLQIVDFWRKYLLSFFKCNLSDTAAQLIASMVMGDRAVALASALKLSFNKVGLSHLLAASRHEPHYYPRFYTGAFWSFAKTTSPFILWRKWLQTHRASRLCLFCFGL
jgi:hypothetical protein